MALVYTPPGVSVTEIVSPTISPLLAAPAQPCIIAPSQGYTTRTDQLLLSGTTATSLPGLPANSTLLGVTSVKNATDPTQGAGDGSGYVVTTDYTVSTSGQTITRVSGGAIASGTLINVTYQYVSNSYFQPTRLDDISSIEQLYGPAYTADGTGINSTLSFAAGVAFENGASSVICQPLFIRTTPGDPTTAPSQPNATQIASTASWVDTLYQLRNYEDINILVPIIGQSTASVTDNGMLQILSAFQDHIMFMKSQNQYIIVLGGEDSTSSTTTAQMLTLQSHATTLAGRYGKAVAEQTVLISPASFQRILPYTAQPINVGAQYVAAGIAGLLSSFTTFTPLTRKQLSNFAAVIDTRTLAQKNADAQNGLLVVEQKGAAVQIRHAITLDTSSAARRELSVVRSKHRMIQSVSDTLNTQIVGQIVADGNATTIVSTAVTTVLERLLQIGELVAYSSVNSRISSLDPTTIEVRFSYKPSFPVNYISIIFSLDLTAASVVVGSTSNVSIG